MRTVTWCVVWTLTVTSGLAQDAAAPQRLNGVWTINKDLSTKPMAPPTGAGDEGDRSGGGRSGGGPPGRGMPGGGPPEGRGGNPDDMRKALAVMQELSLQSARLTITASAESMQVTDDGGVTRRFEATGKTQNVPFNGQLTDVKTKWDHEVLTQEIKAGDMTLTRTWETSTDGHQLAITVTTSGSDGPRQPPTRLVYEHPVGLVDRE
jgi:hypothetical protein